MNTAVQQDNKLVPINQKLSDQQLKRKSLNQIPKRRIIKFGEFAEG